MAAYGEVLIGLALILGLFTGLAAFFGGLLNTNFLLAEAVSGGLLLFILATWLVLAWRLAGYRGLDRRALQKIGVDVPSDTQSAVSPPPSSSCRAR